MTRSEDRSLLPIRPKAGKPLAQTTNVASLVGERHVGGPGGPGGGSIAVESISPLDSRLDALTRLAPMFALVARVLLRCHLEAGWRRA
jgi:hypothetical protein